MKKFLLVLGIVTSVFALVGCGNATKKDSDVSGTNEKTGFDVYNDARQTIDNATKSINAMQSSMINSQLELYKTDDISGSSLLTRYPRLKNTVDSLNAQNAVPGGISISDTFDGNVDSINVDAHYAIELVYDEDTGVVKEILVEEIMTEEAE